MKEIHTISDFFARTHTAFQVFDMGRRIIPLSDHSFTEFENFKSSYAFPLQQQAWLGLLAWDAHSDNDHFIWFLRLPLDEFACLVPAARHDFIYRLLTQLGSSLDNDADSMPQSMEESPYGFTPKQNRMAIFHAKASRLGDQAPSRYYAATRDYLAGSLGFDQWQFLGVQGLADVSARWDLDDNLQRLCGAIPMMPETPWTVLSECLENEVLDSALTGVIVTRIEQALAATNVSSVEIVNGIRAISHAEATQARQNLLDSLLHHAIARDVQILAAISGRCWEDLQEAHLALAYLEALARCTQGQDIFPAVLADPLVGNLRFWNVRVKDKTAPVLHRNHVRNR